MVCADRCAGLAWRLADVGAHAVPGPFAGLVAARGDRANRLLDERQEPLQPVLFHQRAELVCVARMAARGVGGLSPEARRLGLVQAVAAAGRVFLGADRAKPAYRRRADSSHHFAADAGTAVWRGPG